MQVQKKATVAEMWKEISKEYTEKGAYTQMDLRTQFLKLRLAKGADVRQFLGKDMGTGYPPWVVGMGTYGYG